MEQGDDERNDRAMGRRSLLKSTGVALTAGGLAVIPQQATADVPTPEPGGSGPYFKTEQSSSIVREQKIDLTTTVKWSDPYHHKSCNCRAVDFQVSSNATVVQKNSKKLLPSIRSNAIRIDYPKKKVFSGTSKNWIGGMSNYDDPGNPSSGDIALAVVKEVLSYHPYGAKILNAGQTVNRLRRLGSKGDGTEKKKRTWRFSGAKRVCTWARFAAEIGPNEEYSIRIRNGCGKPNVRTDFKLYL